MDDPGPGYVRIGPPTAGMTSTFLRAADNYSGPGLMGRMAALGRGADRTGARRNRGTIERRTRALPSLLWPKRQPVRLPLAGLAKGDVELSTVIVGSSFVVGVIAVPAS
jgi:hypothetical protein